MRKIKVRPTEKDYQRLLKKYRNSIISYKTKESALELLLKERGSYEDYIAR